MTPTNAIEHRILRCRPGDADKYRAMHLALAGESDKCGCGYDFLEPVYCANHGPRPSLRQRIRQAWKALAG